MRSIGVRSCLGALLLVVVMPTAVYWITYRLLPIQNVDIRAAIAAVVGFGALCLAVYRRYG